jgi:GNAT superfamily N-acetyltransferase
MQLESVLAFVQRYYEFDDIPFNRSELGRALEVLLDSPELGRIWIVRVDGEDAGYFILTFGFDAEFGGRHGTLTDLYIDEPYRKHGLGRLIFKFMEAAARELGLKTLELQVERKNVAAQGFYETLGFEPRDRIPMTKRL